MRRGVGPAIAAVVALSALLSGCVQLPAAEPAPRPAGVDSTGLPPRPAIPNWTAAPTPETFTVAASGDVLIHPALTAQATADGGNGRDFRPLLAAVKPAISSADLAICHLDVPLATTDGPFSGWPAFYAPPEAAAALADTGYDACSTASNHTLDRGATGVRTTLDALDAAGIEHTGSARTAAEAQAARVLEVGGAKVGHVSFTFGFNGAPPPRSTPWLANTLEINAVLAAAADAKRAGAEVVIASLHWGEEFQSRPSAEQREVARQLLADDAIDLIVGHRAHVVQPFERINGKWVAYGLGNHLARHAEPRGTTEEGVIGRFRFGKDGSGKWRVEHVEYVPTVMQLGPPIRLLDLSTAPSTDRTRRASGRIAEVVRSLRAEINPATP